MIFSIKPIQRINGFRTILAVTVALLAAALDQFVAQGKDSGNVLRDYSRQWVVIYSVMLAAALLVLALMVITWTPLGKRIDSGLDRWQRLFTKIGDAGWLVFGLIGLLYPLFPLGSYADNLADFYPRLLIFWIFVLAGAIFLSGTRLRPAYLTSLLCAVVVYGAIYEIASFLPGISAFPLSMGWSEGSRYYYASLFLAPSIYGKYYPLPTLHPTRYLLQAVPYLLPGLPLWFHRFWQVMLWLGCTFLGAAALTRRLKISNRWWKYLFAAWAFLFLFQGPVYYHLIISAIIVLWGFDSRKIWRSLVVVLAASIWAGVSRINWFPVPGLLAASLYLLDQPVGKRNLIRYLLPPAVWCAAGLAAAFAAQAVYIAISGNPPGEFSSSLSSYLLWRRLLPNATYEPGIILGSLWVTLPVLWAVLVLAWGRLGHWHWLRPAGLIAILAVFYGGGVIVSVKVGGGSNLHNLDAYLLLLLVNSSYLAFGRFARDADGEAPQRQFHWALAACLVMIPATIAIPLTTPLSLPGPAKARQTVSDLQKLLDNANGRPGEVLMITERQLLPFHAVTVARLEPEYEKVFLMEMVMSNNKAYLNTFYNKLREHQFSLIITDYLNDYHQNQSDAFWVENNLWVDKVVEPVLEYYRPVANFDTIEVLEPKP